MVDSIKKRLPARRPLSEVTERRKSYAAKTPALTFDKVEVTGATPSQSHYLTTLFQPEPDEKIDINQVQDSYYRAVTSGKLENLWPQARFGEDGNNTLLLEASIKNPWKIGVGGWITTSTQSQLYIDLGYHTLSFNSLDVDLRGWVGQTYYAGMASAKFALRTNV
ncbi:MAG: patatin, partial [Muribaculaceae bacterium]|nr:patatin [Muribaculaceae bacterium]